MKTTRDAVHILAIDGCSLDCVKLCLEEAGFSSFDQMRVTDIGLEKGKSPATDENVVAIVKAAREKLGV